MATATFGDMEKKVREFLKDDFPGSFRYKPYQILSGIFDGIRLLHQMRPESRYNGLKLYPFDYPYLTNDSTDEEIEAARAMPWHLDKRWELAIRYYACARCFEIDGADTVNLQRAQDCQNNFTSIVKM